MKNYFPKHSTKFIVAEEMLTGKMLRAFILRSGLVMSALLFCSIISSSQGLIISQYIETNSGTTPKGIELWNTTGSTIDFSATNLEVFKGTNGGALSSDVLVTSGTLADGDVMVIGTTDMGTYLTNQGLSSVLYVDEGFTFNGDDALSVELGGVVQDIFGTPGSDPGSAWSNNGVSSANQNIQLLCDITAGDTDGWSDPSTRFAQVGGGTDLTGFGIAPQACGGGCTIDNISFANLSACNPVDNSYTVEITVEFTGEPADGDLIINGQHFAIGISPQTETLFLDADGNPVDVEVSFLDDPFCTSIAEDLFTAPAACQASNAQGLIISQYVETNSGSTPKGIELWNQTGSTIDFSLENLDIQKGTNGAALTSDVTVTSGTLADGDVMVIGTTDMGTYLTNNGLGSVLFVDYSFTFNGDDALAVVLDGVIEDVFGTEGVDPGSAWSGGGVSTANQNIQLLCDITTVDEDGWSDPSTRFENVGAGTDLTGFGVAPQPCGGPSCSIDNVSAGAPSVCNPVDNSYTVDVTVEYTNDPGGNLVINGEVFAVTGSPQTETLTLDSDGNDVDVDVSFALDPACTSSNPALFTAPAACMVMDPECGNESFSLMGTGSGSYQTIAYVGDDGYNIEATDARADQDINGDAITVRNGALTVFSATGGVKDLTLTTQRVFSGGSGVLTVSINGSPVGTIAYDGTVQTNSILGINAGGTVDIEIATPGNGDRIAMDDLVWTCFSDPAIILSAISGDTDESGTTASFDVTLNTAPASPVQLLISSGNTGENTVSPSVLNFDNTNFDIPQSVTVTGVADGVVDSDQVTTITVAVDDVNSDDDYDGLSNTVNVTNIDIDACDNPLWEVISPTDNNGTWSPVGNGYTANGYCGPGCEEDIDTWLVYGPLDLTSTTSLQLEFDAAENFGTTDLVVQYSTNYELDPCPADASWTGQVSVTDGGFTSIDLSTAAGLSDVYIGIQYADDGADGYSDWELTNFEIISDVCPVVGTPVVSDCSPPAPANDSCTNAEELALPFYPEATNVLGSLSGATATGLSNCDPQIDSFFDVYYEITLTTPNKVYIDVFAFGGFSPTVEVYEGCYGTLQACGVSEGSSDITIVTPVLPAGNHKIRIGSHSPSQIVGSDGDFVISVLQLPFASVQTNPENPLFACNQFGLQLEDFVGATPQTTPGVLDYQWLVAELGGGTLNEWQRGEPNYVSRCSWLGMDYGKTYNVFVRVLVDLPFYGPEWGTYQGDYLNPFGFGASSCTIGTAFSVTPTEVRPNYTPTNAQGNDYSLCDFVVAYNVSNSENFRWRFDGNGTPGDLEDIVYTRGSGNPSVRLSWVNGLLPGTTYQVAVEVQVDGNWSGYSTVHPVSLALPPNNVQLRNSSCGVTVAPNGYVLSQSVCEADNYTFEFAPQDGGATITYTSNNYVCFLNNLSPSVVPGTTYDVRVKVSQGGIDGDYGGICQVTISGPVTPGSGIAAQRDLITSGSATLFPNPNAGDEVRVNLDGLSAGNHEVMIAVYDVYGKQISTQAFGHEGESLSRLVRFDGGMAMGIYMVQIVVDGEQVATERLVVK